MKLGGLPWVWILSLGLAACGPTAPAPSTPRDASTGLDDGAVPDVGGDADVDAGLDTDVGAPDGGADADVTEDVGPGDAESDGGALEVPDDDGDRISNVHEGRGLVDTDQDGVPDSLDLDSDADGIADRIEAGDQDPVTPPRDHDGDLVPNYRDDDSDADEIPDAIELFGDQDGDGYRDFVDIDVDGDGLNDRVETADDADGDGTPNYRDLDSDDDRIVDGAEGAGDFDGDGQPNFVDLDSDGDGIPDAIEGTRDLDRDGAANFVDLDSDGDGLTDAIEGSADFDGDGDGNFVDVDADGDGIRDHFEGSLDVDGDGQPNFLDLDADGDGLSDVIEAQGSGGDEPPPDTDVDGAFDFLDEDADGDFVGDGIEGQADTDGDGIAAYIDFDSDGDALLDLEEAGDEDLLTPPVDSDGDGTADLLDLDSDDDTILDFHEGRADSDGDGVPDRLELDADADGFSDAIEAGDTDLATPPIDTDLDGISDHRDIDSDDDGLADATEQGCPASTDRLRLDSDGDGYQDAAELAVGSEPCDPGSAIDAFYFVLPDSGALDSDTLVFDDTEVDEADVVMNVDTTGSMGGEITNLRSSLQSIIVPGVEAAITSPAFAVSSFQDYPIAPFGSSLDGDEPFSLDLRVSTNTLDVQSALNGLATKNGEDARESGLEALYQVATGDGTSWGSGPSQQVDPFDPAADRVAGVADGDGGGVGFRSDALPIVVHVTDAPSHLGGDYGQSPNIEAATPDEVRDALAAAGARVLSITGEDQARPWSEDQLRTRFGRYCRGVEEPVLGIVEGPQATDADWFELSGVTLGQVVDVYVTAFAEGSTLDPVVGIYDGSGSQIDYDDDGATNGVDAELENVALTGPAPYYVAVSAFNDVDFNGSGAVSAGHYFLEVSVDGLRYGPSRLECSGADAGDDRTSADAWQTWSTATVPRSAGSCEDTCWEEVEFEHWRTPFGIARATGASVPACAWDEFGAGRPAACGAAECCTGKNGAGQSPDVSGACPLSFEIADDGAGMGNAVVTGIEALVNFSEFTISTRVRGDGGAAFDTGCFIQRVTPVVGTAPNTCAPSPVAVDTSTLTPGLDGFESVVPGSVLDFEVVAANLDASGQPCVAAGPNFQTFRAFIDVLADDVAQLATRDVVIVVPPAAPTTNQ